MKSVAFGEPNSKHVNSGGPTAWGCRPHGRRRTFSRPTFPLDFPGNFRSGAAVHGASRGAGRPRRFILQRLKHSAVEIPHTTRSILHGDSRHRTRTVEN